MNKEKISEILFLLITGVVLVITLSATALLILNSQNIYFKKFCVNKTGEVESGDLTIDCSLYKGNKINSTDILCMAEQKVSHI